MIKGQPTTYPGIYRLPTGQYWIRAMVWDPTRGKPKDTSKTLPLLSSKTGAPVTMEEAITELADLRSGLKGINPAVAARKTFGDYADEVVARKVAKGNHMSNATAENWSYDMKHLRERWGDVYLDTIRRVQVEKWAEDLGKLVTVSKTYKPSTVNGWLAKFKTIMGAAARQFEIADPSLDVEGTNPALHKTYTRKQPNSLLVEELPAFFAVCREYHPNHFAMLMLGQLTGRRACELRAIRRTGRDADIEWDTGILDIGRSQTIGEPMNQTKQKKDVTLYLPPTLVALLQAHVDGLKGKRAESELLFPPFWSRTGSKYMSRWALRKVLIDICEKAKIKKKITPKGAMRRTYQDLCRAADVRDVVQMAMSGHATVAMRMHYSTVAETEGKASLTRMATVAGLIAA